MELDPYPWTVPGEYGRYGFEYPKYDGKPMVHLGLEFHPGKGYSQNREDYPDHGWTAEELAYARGYHDGYMALYESFLDSDDES